jgi:hypothetical protein
MRGSLEEAGIDGCNERCNRRVAQALMDEFRSICSCDSVVGECGNLGWEKGGLWDMTFTGAGS